MTTFSYVALDPAGKKKSGFIDASDQHAAIALVAAEGRYVVEIKEEAGKKHHAKRRDGGEERKSRTTKADLALFTRRLADLSGAGLPLDRVLMVLAEQSESEQLAQVAEDALEDVKTGIPVSEALAKTPKLFPQMYTQTLKAGEASGQFPESATRLADLMENDVARRSQIVSALIYPAVLTGAAIFVIIFLLTFVIPRLSGVFKGLGRELPAPTKVLLSTTDAIQNNWLVMLAAVVAIVIAYRAWISTQSGKEFRDATLLKLPGIGKILRKALVSRYSRVLGTLVNGGVPILEAIDLAGLASANLVFIKRNEVVAEEVREGRTIASALKDAGDFPPVLTHMVAIGEETGDLPKMLGRVSDSLDFEVEHGLRRLTSLAEPIIVLAMGTFVAFVVLAVLLPIFQAQDLIK
ncbi:MAG TPA: type II secretion system F family protein [Fimbriimonadaceae bacterium]|nr:type II secretion system F family protein [Fimbriimonadaceae bacterium]